MAQKKGPRKTRRAERRRAQSARERDDVEESERDDDADDSEDEGDADDSEDEGDADDSEDEGDADDARAESEEEHRPNRRERRAQRAKSSEIRDRNLRMRQEAADKRRAKRERERAQAAAEGLDTSELVDDALARGADTAARLVRRHFKWIQWLLVGGVVAGFAWLIYGYRQDLADQKNSKALMQALRDESAIVKGSEPALDMPQSGFVDTRPEFESDKKRWEEAKREYEAAMKGDPNPARQELARLGLAGALFEQGKYKEAKELYEKVKGSALGGTDRDVRGRALEGLALCLEALKKPEDARKTFKELENLGAERFTALARYHRARLLYGEGKKDEAKKLLVKALEKFEKEEKTPGTPPGFVEVASRQLLEAIDPSAAPKPASGITPEQLEQLKKQLEAAQKGQDVANLLKSLGDKDKAPAEDEASEKGSDDAPDEEAQPEPPPPAPAPQGQAPAPKKTAPSPAKKPAAPVPVQPVAPAAPKAPAPAPAAPAPAPAPAPAAPEGAPAQ